VAAHYAHFLPVKSYVDTSVLVLDKENLSRNIMLHPKMDAACLNIKICLAADAILLSEYTGAKELQHD
jgi:hypothetical protein